MTLISMDRAALHTSGSASNAGLMGRMKNFISRSRAERQLRQLDDRMLADIGIVRSDISARVWGN